MIKSVTKTNKTTNKSIGLSIFYVSLTCMFFSILDSSAKYLSAFMPFFLIIWFRFFSQGVVTLFIGFSLPKSYWRSKAIKLQLLRGLAMTLTTVSNFIALQYLPLTTTAAIFFCSPLILCFLSPFMLNEKVGIRRWTAVVIGIIGVLIIIRPGAESFHWSLLVSLSSAAFFSFYTIFTRKVTLIDSMWTNFLYMPWVAIIILTPFVISEFKYIPEDNFLLFMLLFLGIVGGLGHFLLINALKLSEASFIAPFQYQQILYMTFIGWLIFNNLPDLQVLIGSLIVVISGLYVWHRERVNS